MERAERSDMWIEAGLKELGRGGIEGVRVEVLAERLGITEGRILPAFQGPPGAA